MLHQEALDEYLKALKLGQRELKALTSAGKESYPAVLDTLIEGGYTESFQEIGLVEIPVDQIVGVKSAGRITAFTASFLPLLNPDSEFGTKWINLCADHLGETGIREPILCYEYLGKFYIQEGNKRVSVLKHFGAPRITGTVTRVVPARTEEPRIKAYFEFTDFYKYTKIYSVQYRQPGDYARLLSALGKDPGEAWDSREQRTFNAYFLYFREAFEALGGAELDILPEEALLLWLKVYTFRDLGQMTAGEIKKALSGLWEDVKALSQPEPVAVRTEPGDTESTPGILGRIVAGTPARLKVAFVHPQDPVTSPWIKGHDQGRQYLEEVLGSKVTVSSYFGADTQELADMLLEQAVSEGAEVVFSTTPQLSRATLRAAVKYPKVRFLNCSVDTPYSSIRTYYSRIFEAKFITGAIAGAMANNDRIGYVGSNPIFGVPASINAFALGAQMTNPRARIDLRWSCMPGSHQTDFVREGIQVISNRDVPTQERAYLEFCNYGTYALDESGKLIPLASPCWVWGKFYEKVIRSILSGAWEKDKDSPRAVNYWWGMDSGVIDVTFSDQIPEGVRVLAETLRAGLQNGTIDPFLRRVVAQDGTVKNDGSRGFTADELLHMDWLCENVDGFIPTFDQIAPYARNIVRALGIYRDQIPAEKEGSL